MKQRGQFWVLTKTSQVYRPSHRSRFSRLLVGVAQQKSKWNYFRAKEIVDWPIGMHFHRGKTNLNKKSSSTVFEGLKLLQKNWEKKSRKEIFGIKGKNQQNTLLISEVVINADTGMRKVREKIYFCTCIISTSD